VCVYVGGTEVDVAEVGFKYHMNKVNATIGLAQLDCIAPLLARHIENGRYLDTALQDLGGLEPCRFEARAAPSYWFYTVMCDDAAGLSNHLTAHGIGNSKAHKRNDLHSVFAASRCELPGLDRFYPRMLHIPCGWWVDDEARAYMVDVLRRGW
jgi:dTDP-4-amino-4,6-dideoxygalactose transaminase